jgi:hypothetical protein
MQDVEVVKPTRLIDWGVAQRALPGENVSGDHYLVKAFAGGVLVAVVDGVGHGDEATAAAKTATATLSVHAGDSAIALMRRCHEALRLTRGVVMTVVTFLAGEGVVNWLGVGNVEGLLLRAETKANPPSEPVLLRSGFVGYQLPALVASVLPVARGDLLVLTSDGIRSDFSKAINPKQPPQAIADCILAQHFKGTDDVIVVVARYLGNRNE